MFFFFFFSSRRRHTRSTRDWSSDVCSSDLPYGIELGMLLKMLQDTKSHWLSGFLASDFSRVSPRLAEDICKAAGLSPRARPRDIHGQAAETLYKAIQSTKIMAPPTN